MKCFAQRGTTSEEVESGFKLICLTQNLTPLNTSQRSSTCFFVPLCAYLFSLAWNIFFDLCLVNLTPCTGCYRCFTHILLAPIGLVHAIQTSNCQHLQFFLPESFLKFLAPAQHTHMAGQKCQEMNAHRGSSQLVLMGDDHPAVHWSLDSMEVLTQGSHCFPTVTRKIKLHLPTIVNLLNNSFSLTAFLSCLTFSLFYWYVLELSPKTITCQQILISA